VSQEQLEELGPIDYVVLEWPGEQPEAGEVQPLLVDLVDRGIIRILDIAFVAKDLDGSVSRLELGEFKQVAEAFAEFEGASSGLLGFEDLQEAATALEPGTSAAVLVWENRWAAPVAAALRRSGGQLVASGRLPVQAILAALPIGRGRRPIAREHHARTASRGRPHRRHRWHGNRRQQPCLTPAGRTLATAGP
jgi:hypothetical protein